MSNGQFVWGVVSYVSCGALPLPGCPWVTLMHMDVCWGVWVAYGPLGSCAPASFLLFVWRVARPVVFVVCCLVCTVDAGLGMFFLCVFRRMRCAVWCACACLRRFFRLGGGKTVLFVPRVAGLG